MNQSIIDRYENNVDFIPDVVEGKFEIPYIHSEEYKPLTYVPFHQAKFVKDATDVGIHFFIHDFQFQRLWTHREMYRHMLERFSAVMSPDFSMFTDWSFVIQLYNHYRRQLLGAWMQSIGITVYPTICWGDETTFPWCFDGCPTNATVCVSSTGTQKHKETKRLFLLGYEKMMERLSPKTIVFYGVVPTECKGNIVPIEPYYKKIEERKKKT